MSRLVLVATIFVAASALAAAPDRAQILKVFSYEKLQDAANYMEARLEHPDGKILSCDPDIAKVKAWVSGPLRSLIDDQKTEVLKEYLQRPVILQAGIKECTKSCRCDAFAAVLEEADGKIGKSRIHLKNKNFLKQAQAKPADDQNLKCARQLAWFCKSDLLKFLEAQDVEETPAK